MAVAMCFLTVGDVTQPALWSAYAARAAETAVFCHPKKPEEVISPFLRERIVAKRVPTAWGHPSLVLATLCLFHAAYMNGLYDHFILLSDTTIPIVPPDTVEAGLRAVKGKSLINYRVPEPGSEHMRRRQALSAGAAYEPFFAHDQWVILCRRHVRLLLETPRLDAFAGMFAADEHYIQNVLAHDCGVAPGEILRQGRTFVNWQETERREMRDAEGQVKTRSVHPKTYDELTAAELLQAREQGNWFFRKVSAACDCTEAAALVQE